MSGNIEKITSTDTGVSNQSEVINSCSINNSPQSMEPAVEISNSVCTENILGPAIEAVNKPAEMADPVSAPVKNTSADVVNEQTVTAANMAANTETEQPPAVSEMEQLKAVGAGDPCLVSQTDIPSKLEKTAKQVIDTVESDDKTTISRLQQIIQKITHERDGYRKTLDNAEKKLATLQTSYDSLMKGGGDEMTLRCMVDQLRGKLAQTALQLDDRMRIVAHQEKQINALNNQVSSLKEVESLTKSLLQIRNMEVKHLQSEVDDMEVRISEERERYKTMIKKMDSAVQLNADLKKEYETQLCLFRDLREKYEEKVTLLSAEKQALENNAQNK